VKLNIWTGSPRTFFHPTSTHQIARSWVPR